jgi:citrate lyase subunit beta/citryl-CoA lyase
MTTEVPAWRSLLFVPASNERFISKAHERGADAIILDLEDSVAPSLKPEARRLLPETLKRVSQNGADVLVRINRPLRLAIADLEAAVIPGITALMLPKCEGPGHVQLLAETVSEIEAERGMAEGTIRFFLLIESAAALNRAQAIAEAHPRIFAISLGAEDFASDLQMVPDGETLYVPKIQTLLAARAAGVAPFGFIGTVADYKDLESFRETLRKSKRYGFEGAAVIHPALVPILNEEYGPSEEEIASAQRIVDAYRASTQAGLGAIEVEGKMVDVPVMQRAEQLLQKAARIKARQS